MNAWVKIDHVNERIYVERVLGAYEIDSNPNFRNIPELEVFVNGRFSKQGSQGSN